MAPDLEWPSYVVDCTITLTQSRLRLRGNERELICYRYPVTPGTSADTFSEVKAALTPESGHMTGRRLLVETGLIENDAPKSDAPESDHAEDPHAGSDPIQHDTVRTETMAAVPPPLSSAVSAKASGDIVTPTETGAVGAGDKSYLILQRAGAFPNFSLWQMRSAYVVIHRSGVVVPAILRSPMSAAKALERLGGVLPQGDEEEVRVLLSDFLIDEDILLRQFQRIPRFRYTVTNFQSD